MWCGGYQRRPDGLGLRKYNIAKLMLEAAEGGTVEAATQQVKFALLMAGKLDMK